MSERAPSWEALNAYVDGELAPAQAAEVARALADDRDLAAQVAMLARLKAAVGETIETVSLPRSVAAKGGRSRRLVAVAAGLAAILLVAIGAGLYFGLPLQGQPAWVAEAVTAHRHWLAQDQAHLDQPLQAGIVMARLRRFDPAAEVPDLSAAKLSLSFVGPLDPTGRTPGLLVGYVGTRSCHVSLLIIPAFANMTVDQQQYHDGHASVFAWRAGQLGYVLTAIGMDESHLTLIARTVWQAIQDRRPLDADARSALRHSRNVSRPCAA